MGDSEIIISGAEYTGPEYNGSIAEYMIPKLKSHPKDIILQVDCGTNETITCGEFLRQSLEVTEGLIKLGLKEGDVIIFSCSNSIRSHIATIGALCSGGIYTPIDETLRAAELQHFFKLFQPKFILCESAKAKEIQKNAKAVNVDPMIVVIDSNESNEEFLGWEDIRTSVDVDKYTPRKVKDSKKDTALLICSSGSTGLPKGVELSHYAILFNLSAMEYMGVYKLDNGFLLTSPLFWVSGILLTIYTCYFGQIRFVPKSTDSEDILKAIDKYKPSLLMFAPSCLLDIVQNPNFKKYDVSCVETIYVGGAVLSPALKAKVKSTWSNVSVLNCYGLTETSGGITAGIDSEKPNAVGKLISDIKIKIVDVDTGKTLGPNKVGECKIKTKRLMLGYYKNEKATKDAFDEDGWLCTGDLACFDENEELYVVGRIKESIMYLNYKISPIQVESFIIGLPGVKDVAVVAVPHETDTNHLKALVVKDPASNITAEDIIRGVKENFTDRHHLRQGVEFVDALPRTRAGKLRRRDAEEMVKDKQ